MQPDRFIAAQKYFDLKVGDSGTAKYVTGDETYRATITSLNSNGTVTVDWTDVELDHKVIQPHMFLEVLSAASDVKAVSDLKVGDRGKAYYAANNRTYRATIASLNDNGTVTVDWDDGDTKHKVIKPDKFIPATQKISDLKVGDRGEAYYGTGTSTSLATIASLNDDGTVTVNWDDGDTKHKVIFPDMFIPDKKKKKNKKDKKKDKKNKEKNKVPASDLDEVEKLKLELKAALEQASKAQKQAQEAELQLAQLKQAGAAPSSSQPKGEVDENKKNSSVCAVM